MKRIKKFFWFFLGITTGVIYAFLKAMSNKKVNGTVRKTLDKINMTCEKKLLDIQNKENKLREERKKNEEIVKRMSRNNLISDIKRRLRKRRQQ